MSHCAKGHRVITATQELFTFTPDPEPFEAGVKEDCGFDEIEAYVCIGILWCPECQEVVSAWIEEPNISTGGAK